MNSKKKYKLVLAKPVQKQLHKMDRYQSTLLIRWLYLNVDGVSDPRSTGKKLTGDLADFWRYRVGNYRIIVEILDDQLVVVAINIGHRQNIYESKK